IGRTQARRTSSQYSKCAVWPFLYVDAEPAQTRKRRPAIRAGCIVRQPRRAVRERGEDRVAMRDGFIARDSQPPAQAPGGSNRCGVRRRHHSVELMILKVAREG